MLYTTVTDLFADSNLTSRALQSEVMSKAIAFAMDLAAPTGEARDRIAFGVAPILYCVYGFLQRGEPVPPDGGTWELTENRGTIELSFRDGRVLDPGQLHTLTTWLIWIGTGCEDEHGPDWGSMTGWTWGLGDAEFDEVRPAVWCLSCSRWTIVALTNIRFCMACGERF